MPKALWQSCFPGYCISSLWNTYCVDRIASPDIVSVLFKTHIVFSIFQEILMSTDLPKFLCKISSVFFLFFFETLCLNTPVREMSVYFTGPSFECIPRRTFVTDSSILTEITSSRGRFYITSRRRNPKQRQTEKTRTACTSLQSNCGSSYFPQIFSTFGTSNRGQQRNLLRQYSSARYYLLQSSV